MNSVDTKNSPWERKKLSCHPPENLLLHACYALFTLNPILKLHLGNSDEVFPYRSCLFIKFISVCWIFKIYRVWLLVGFQPLLMWETVLELQQLLKITWYIRFVYMHNEECQLAEETSLLINPWNFNDISIAFLNMIQTDGSKWKESVDDGWWHMVAVVS